MLTRQNRLDISGHLTTASRALFAATDVLQTHPKDPGTGDWPAAISDEIAALFAVIESLNTLADAHVSMVELTDPGAPSKH